MADGEALFLEIFDGLDGLNLASCSVAKRNRLFPIGCALLRDRLADPESSVAFSAPRHRNNL